MERPNINCLLVQRSSSSCFVTNLCSFHISVVAHPGSSVGGACSEPNLGLIRIIWLPDCIIWACSSNFEKIDLVQFYLNKQVNKCCKWFSMCMFQMSKSKMIWKGKSMSVCVFTARPSTTNRNSTRVKPSWELNLSRISENIVEFTFFSLNILTLFLPILTMSFRISTFPPFKFSHIWIQEFFFLRI